MNSPIINDPITMVAEAFAALHPDAKYEASYVPDIRDGDGTLLSSYTSFPREEEGPDAVPDILLNILTFNEAGITAVAESFAHELVHVALGPDSLEHGPEYDETLKKLAAKFDEIAEERSTRIARTQAEGGTDNETE